MVTLLSLSAALLYGSADFLGGAATRRAQLLSVLLVSSAAGVAVQVCTALAFGGQFQTAGLGWGVLAGTIGAVGLAFFYAGLAAGPMSVVSPVAALVSTVLPVGIAIIQGERPGLAVYAGGLLCLGATVLVSTGGHGQDRFGEDQLGADGQPEGAVPGWRRRVRGAAYGIAAGTAFGLFFLFIKNGGQAGAFWPVAAARSAGLVVYLLAALVVRTGPIPWRTGWLTFAAAVGSGAIDATANTCYVMATRHGLFGLAVVLTSLYPAVTVLAARVFLRERMHRVQQAGLLLAMAGIALVSA
jgi:drug/metabolite transporter (DMT)-like permease